MLNIGNIYNQLRRKILPASKEDLSWRFDQLLSVILDISERLANIEVAARNNGALQARGDDVLGRDVAPGSAKDAKTVKCESEGRGLSRSGAEEFVIKAYKGVLRRDPDPEGLRACVQALVDGEISCADVIASMMDSHEYAYLPEKDPRVSGYLTPGVIALTDEVRAFQPFSVDDIQKLGVEFSGFEYFEVHKARFTEMVNFVSFCRNQKSSQLRVLECGSTISTKLIKAALPDISLAISDFKTFGEIEAASMFRIADIVDDHFQLDFQKDDLDAISYEGDPKFDVILLCEVIEHVLVNPTKVFRFLLKHLSEDGVVYITTPNVFQRSYLEAYRTRINPVRIFPENYTLEDAPHFHVREYSMSEMLQAVSMAGGDVSAFYFSSCWDDAERLSDMPENEYSNLIVVMSKRKDKVGGV